MSFFDEAAGWVRSGYVVVWQSGLIVTSSPAEHLKTVRQALARLGNTMLQDWLKKAGPEGQSAVDAYRKM